MSDPAEDPQTPERKKLTPNEIIRGAVAVVTMIVVTWLIIDIYYAKFGMVVALVVSGIAIFVLASLYFSIFSKKKR